jgi:hypothetical protein
MQSGIFSGSASLLFQPRNDLLTLGYRFFRWNPAGSFAGEEKASNQWLPLTGPDTHDAAVGFWGFEAEFCLIDLPHLIHRKEHDGCCEVLCRANGAPGEVSEVLRAFIRVGEPHGEVKHFSVFVREGFELSNKGFDAGPFAFG